MTNNDIILNTVQAAFNPDQLQQLAEQIYTVQQIEARRAGCKIVMEDATPEKENAFFLADLVSAQFHTFAEWKRMGYSVKKGQHAALVCNLWQYTDKPGKAARDAAASAGKDAPETDPHFYRTKSYLFFRAQVEKRS